MSEKIEAVIFDVGGVVVGSPFIAISQAEEERGLPKNYINVALSKLGADGAFQKYERGEIPYDEFIARWNVELNEVRENNAAYEQYAARRNLPAPSLPASLAIDAHTLFSNMMAVAERPNDVVVDLIKSLRAQGYKVAALTNNFQNDSTSGQMKKSFLGPLFHHFVESSVVGLRKPDPRFYLHACDLLGVKPTQAVFVDDIGVNLRGARQLGMTTVHVDIGKEAEAVENVKRIVRERGVHIAKL
jgi:HAD superfamily hydrolase (TIGR01509 family)